MNKSSQRGQVLPFVGICLVVLLGMAALAVDVGYLQYQQRLQQTASDAAALAGAAELAYDLTGYASAGQTAATANGFTADGTPCSTTCVQLYSPPTQGPYAGNPDAVEAIITEQYPAFFAAVIGHPNTSVSTRAVALVEPNEPGACIYILNGQLNTNSPHASIISPACGVMVNGDVKSQNGNWNTPFIDATGWITATDPGGTETPNIPNFNDPCQRVPGCAALSQVFTASNPEGFYSGTTPTTPAAGTTTLSPGYYTSLGNLTGTVTLEPGTYLLGTGGTNANLTGSGVTIVLLNGGVNNGLNTNLSAVPPATGAQSVGVSQTSGAPGVLYYSLSSANTPMNSSTQILNGMMYFPNMQIELNGTGSSLTTTFLVAGIIIGDQLTITVPPNGGGNDFVQQARLVE